MSFPNPARRRGLGQTAIHNNLLMATGSPVLGPGLARPILSLPSNIAAPVSTSTNSAGASLPAPVLQTGLRPVIQPVLQPVSMGSPITAQVAPPAPTSSNTAVAADEGTPASTVAAPAATTSTATTDGTTTTSSFSAWLAGSTTIFGFTIGNEWLLFGGGGLALVLLLSMRGGSSSGKKR